MTKGKDSLQPQARHCRVTEKSAPLRFCDYNRRDHLLKVHNQKLSSQSHRHSHPVAPFVSHVHLRTDLLDDQEEEGGNEGLAPGAVDLFSIHAILRHDAVESQLADQVPVMIVAIVPEDLFQHRAPMEGPEATRHEHRISKRP